MPFIRNNFAPLIVIALGGVLSLLLAFAPLDFLISSLVSDDAFYYFEMARHIAAGAGSTFDGVNPTNGYHPLWLVTLVPIFHFFSAGGLMDTLPIHVALALSALLNVGVGLVMLRVLSRYTQSGWIKALALAAWFFNPFNVYEMVNGLETPLSLFLVALFILCALRVSERGRTRDLVLAGVVGGFMMLARLDNVFYFVAYLAWFLYDSGLRAGIRRALWSGFSATVVVLPWLLWNAVMFGMLLTSASLATTIVNHQLIIQDHGTSVFQFLKAIVYTTDRELRLLAVQTGAPAVFLVLLGVALAWLRFGREAVRGIFAKPIPVEYFLFGGFLLNFLVNASFRWSVRSWYFIPFNIFLVMWLAWLFEKLREKGALRMGAVGLVACFTLGLFFISWEKELRGRQASQREMLASAQWMNENLPEGSVIGVFNAGIQGYFSKHRVVNLDGLVNNPGFDALRDRTLWAYIQNEKIAYLSDFDVYLQYRFKSFWGIDDPFSRLEPIHNMSDANGVRIYRVK